jgi:general secretion pathway protein K
LRTYYLATAGTERAMLYMLWGGGARNPDGRPKYWAPGVPVLQFHFPAGDARVEVIPETAKFDINKISKEELYRLLLNLGAGPERAGVVTEGIIDWRTASAAEPDNLLPGPSFRPRHASLEEIEELLLVKGMTPELFYGSYVRDPEGRLTARGGLKDCVSVYGTTGSVDVNYAEPAVLATLGMSPAAIPALLERRRAAPFRSNEEVGQFAQFAGGPGFNRLQLGTGTMFTLRSSARLRLPDGRYSDLRRTVGALVKIRTDGTTPPLEVLRWYDN